MNKKGFSAIELLVIIAIISLLAGIFIPAFQRAKAASEKSIKFKRNEIIIEVPEQTYCNCSLRGGGFE